MSDYPTRYYPWLVGLILLLLIPSLFINLGLLPLIADEATRALVAHEMDVSGNLITPTLNGELYFNKPPLYNWILLGFYHLFDSKSEFIIRLPAVLSLLMFALLIFLGIKPHMGKRVAFVSSLALITCGRVMFYDSMLGLIDLSYSLLIFLNFLVIIHFSRHKKYLGLFLLSWSLTGISFLMKGLPSLLFQVLSLGVILFYNKNLRQVLSFKHLAGILIFFGITGSYYYALLSQNPGENYFSILLEESTKRTVIEYGIRPTVVHFFTFPFEQIYHLFPWSFLLIFLFRKRFYKNIRRSWFLSSLSLIFLINIPVYWLSVETYPRYLFMLYPILLILVINHYFLEISEKGLFQSISDRLFLILLLITFPAILTGTLIYPFSNPDPVKTVMILMTLFLAGIILTFWKITRIRPELIILVVLILRIGFNLVVLPERKSVSREQRQKEQAETIADITAGSPLYLYRNTVISVENSYYISSNRNMILRRSFDEKKQENYYLIEDRIPPEKNEEILYRFEIRWENVRLRLVRFIEMIQKEN